ncbi:MAG: hypothetical protein ABI614_04550 [Planctomycetota bacterium]
MKNRIPDYLPASSHTDQASEATLQELRALVRERFAEQMRQAETFVREHPVSGLGAAVCLGILLGWVIKRK